MPEPAPAAVTPAAWTGERIAAVVARARTGDGSAVPELREVLRLKPDAADILGGNLAERAADALLAAHCGADLFRRETVAKKVADLRAELGGPDPSAVERLLAERAALCWLHLHHLEAAYAGKGAMAVALADHYQRCIDRAHRRYITSLKAVAQVRRVAGQVKPPGRRDTGSRGVEAPGGGAVGRLLRS